MDKYKEKLIDSFLQGQLSDEEQIEFDRLLREEDEFKKEIEIMHRIKIGFEKKGERSALNEIKALSSKKEFEKIISNAEKKYRKTSHKVIYSFISLGVACAVFIFIYMGIQWKYSSDLLFKEYYSEAVYENVPVRGGQLLSEHQQDLKIKATDLYKQQDYSQALVLYNELKAEVDNNELSEDILFYSAMCLIEGDQYNAAIEDLKPLFENGIYFNEKAGWYLALIYLKEDKRKETISILTKLIDDDTDYQDVSIDILSKINKKKLF